MGQHAELALREVNPRVQIVAMEEVIVMEGWAIDLEIHLNIIMDKVILPDIVPDQMLQVR